MRLFDAFSFNDELDLLEIRLHELEEVAYRHVLVESPMAHSGKPKPLHYAENRARFEEFEEKIEHVVVPRLPILQCGDRWVAENFQRNHIALGWGECCGGDWVLVSDVDEIPSAAALEAAVEEDRPAVFRQDHHYFWLNARRSVKGWTGPVLMPWSGIKVHNASPQKLRDLIGRGRTKDARVLEGGWHFSWLGGPERFAEKTRCFAHGELDRPAYQDEERLREMMDSGHVRIRDREFDLEFVPFSAETHPAWAVENAERFRGLVKEVDSPEQRRGQGARRGLHAPESKVRVLPPPP